MTNPIDPLGSPHPASSFLHRRHFSAACVHPSEYFREILLAASSDLVGLKRPLFHPLSWLIIHCASDCCLLSQLSEDILALYLHFPSFPPNSGSILAEALSAPDTQPGPCTFSTDASVRHQAVTYCRCIWANRNEAHRFKTEFNFQKYCLE